MLNTAIIAAGGYGVRFLPFTKGVSKEMLPIGGVPAVQWVIQECIDAGFRTIYVVTRPGSSLIKEQFQIDEHLEKYLKKNQKNRELLSINYEDWIGRVEFIEEDHSIPYGNAASLLTLKNRLIALESFAILFADDVIINGEGIAELIPKNSMGNVDAAIAIKEVQRIQMHRYGNVELFPGTKKVRTIIQKPMVPENITSPFALVSRIILTPKIFDFITFEDGCEPDLGIAISKMAQKGNVIAKELKGTWVSVDDPDSYTIALLKYWLASGNRPQINNLIRRMLLEISEVP